MGVCTAAEPERQGKSTMLTVVVFRDQGARIWSCYYQTRMRKATTHGIKQVLNDRLVPIV